MLGFSFIFGFPFVQQIVALHAERIANFLTAKSDPSWPEAELQDRILEDDLDIQLKNLKAYINDPRVENLEMPGQQRAEKLHSDMEMMDHPLSVPTADDVYGATPEAQHTASVSSSMCSFLIAIVKCNILLYLLMPSLSFFTFNLWPFPLYHQSCI